MKTNPSRQQESPSTAAASVAENGQKPVSFRLPDNRPARETQLKQKSIIHSAAQPVQGKWMTITYFLNGKFDSVVGLDSKKLSIDQLHSLLRSPEVSKNSKPQIQEAIDLKETKDHGEFGDVGNADLGDHARKFVSIFAQQEDLFVKTKFPELEDTEVVAHGGTLYFKKNKNIVSGSFKYGIAAGSATMHLVTHEGDHRHSSTAKGGPVFSAGDILVNNGIVTYIDNNSGHYKPEIEFFANGMRHLYHAGFLLPGKFTFGFNDGNKLHHLDLSHSKKLLQETEAPKPKKPEVIELLDD